MLDKGFNYLLYEEKTDGAFKLFGEMVSAGSKGLCITTMYPSKLKKMYKLGEAKVLWLSDSKDEPDTLSPTRLDFEITREITKFIKDNKEGVILLDGFGYLTLENEFDKVRKFIKRTNDLSSMNSSTFMVVVNPDAFSKETVTTLARDFDKVEDVAALLGGKPAEPAKAEAAPAAATPAAAPQPPAARIEYKAVPQAPAEEEKETIEIEDIYLIHRSTGTLIQRRTWRDSDLIDPDLIGGMFQAILDFINNSFAKGQASEFSRIEVKGYIILIGDGKFVSIALVFSGKAEEILAKTMSDIKKVIRENIANVEKQYEGVLSTYDGDVSKLRGARKILDTLSSDINKALEPQLAEKGYKRKLSPVEQQRVNDKFSEASTLARQQKYHDALKAYDEALRVDPDNARCLFNKAVILQMMGNNGAAIECYDRVIAINPSDSETYSNKGIALRGLGRTQEAIDAYRQGIEVNPSDATLWSNMGIAMRSMGRIKEALEAYDRALALNPADAGVWSNKGVVLGSMGLLKEAIECYDRALAIDPRRELARRNRELAVQELEKRGGK
ncbi:MAG: tetratricopeptide repeat protein [Euryarchaeota archaeon]|nr:tetratricopeptide repeat protein [Euryarchaeota archaeon]